MGISRISKQFDYHNLLPYMDSRGSIIFDDY